MFFLTKSKILFTSALVSALANLSSCTDDSVIQDEKLQSYTITAELITPTDMPEGRCCMDVEYSNAAFIGMLWQPTDKIGVFSENTSTGNYLFSNTATENVRKAEFSGEMPETPFYAYYPYNESNASVNALNGSVLAEQPYNPDNGTLACDYKYGTLKEGTTNQFSFKQLFTLLRFNINASGTVLEGERLESITLKVTDAEGNPRNICGDFTFSALDGKWQAVSNTISNIVTMPWTSHPVLSKNTTYQGYITVMPDVAKTDQLTIEILTNSHKATLTADCLVNFEAGYIYTLPLELQSFEGNENFTWSVEELLAPTITSFGFNVSDNKGKLLNNKLVWSNQEPSFTNVSSHSAMVNEETGEITLTIPYLYDFKLIPTFTLSSSEDCTVSVNGVEQTSGTSEVDFTNPVTYTVSNKYGHTRNFIVKVVNTGLPIVVVKHSTSGDFSKSYRGGTEIFGTVIGGTLTNEFVDFYVRGKDKDWVTDDQITIYNADGTVDCNVTGGVRLRGNTTQTYPKKPLGIKLNSKTSVLGMPAHKRWALLANQLDHSMIRNTIALDIAHLVENAWREKATDKPGIPWCPSGKNVELIVVDKEGDAHHVGNYFLAEQIKIDENRLNIKEPMDIETDASASDYTQFGYLIEGVTSDKKDEPSNFTSNNGIIFQFKDELSSTILNQVKTKMNRIESNIINGNYATAYDELDIYSLIDQMLIWELTLNREYGDPSSVYMYLDGAGKLSAGPVWDFDRGTFQNQELAKSGSNANTKRVKPDNEWMYWRKSSDESYIWYSQLAKDPTFQQAVKDRWANIYPYLQQMESQIRAYGSSLKTSWECNNAMWPTTRSAVRSFKSDFTDWSGDEELGTFDEVINNLVTVYQERLAGMNTLITSGDFVE